MDVTTDRAPKSLRIVFLGTPQFAATCLEQLLESRHEVVGVVTAPDRPAGRGRSCVPVKSSRLPKNTACLWRSRRR